MTDEKKEYDEDDWIDEFLKGAAQHAATRTKGMTTPIPHLKFNPSTGKMEDVTGKR